MLRESLLQLETELSRRSFLGVMCRAAGLVAALDRFGASAFGARDTGGVARVDEDVARRVYSRIGDIVIPIDEDLGWISFEPEISDYGLTVFAGQVFLGGNPDALEGLTGALNFMNEAPPQIGYGVRFLDMAPASQVQYFTDILTGQFEKAGMQDVLGLAGTFGLVSTKAVFFSNFPRHLAQDSDFQVIPASSLKTGWDIMRWKGPVGPEEESSARITPQR